MPAPIVRSLKEVLEAFDGLGPATQKALLHRLDTRGDLDAFKRRFAIDAERTLRPLREDNQTLRQRIAQLEEENQSLRQRQRLGSEQIEKMIYDLDQEEWNSKEIAAQLRSEGVRLSPAAIRQRLSRLRRDK